MTYTAFEIHKRKKEDDPILMKYYAEVDKH